MTFLLQATGSTFARKSGKSAYAPFARRVVMIDATTFSPTLRMADKPNRMSVPTGVKLESEELTSGGRTLMPIRRHSWRYCADLSLSSLIDVSSAAMYSAGKFALRYAVQYDTRP